METIISIGKKAVSGWHLACMGVCILLPFLVSCSQLTGAKEKLYIREHDVHNIYGVVDMSLFHGFESKVTVAELRAKHGEPSIVFDGKKSDADGYDIWKYVVQQDTIDCYVKRESGIVDYIYSVFAKPRKIHNIIKDKRLADDIISVYTSADFLVDDFDSTIRISKKRYSTKYAINIAIDDNELLVDSKPLRENLYSLHHNFLYSMIALCDTASWSYNNKVMSINFDVNETPCEIIEKIKSNSDFGNQCTILLFGDKGPFSLLKSKIVDEKVDINMVFKDNKSKSTAMFNVNAWRLLASPTTALQRIKAMATYDNMVEVNNEANGDFCAIISDPIEIKNNALYISETFTNVLYPPDTTDTSKNYMTTLLLDNECEYALLCAQSGLGLNLTETFSPINGKQITYTAYFTNDELKALREKIK